MVKKIRKPKFDIDGSIIVKEEGKGKGQPKDNDIFTIDGELTDEDNLPKRHLTFLPNITNWLKRHAWVWVKKNGLGIIKKAIPKDTSLVVGAVIVILILFLVIF